MEHRNVVPETEGCMKNRNRLLFAVGALLLVCQGGHVHAQEPVHLTLAEAEKLAVKNNPQLSAAVLDAAASFQVPIEYRAAYLPTLQGNATGVVSEQGSRLAAGGLNNPIVYNRFAAGLTLSQMITDFGRTGNLVDMARLRADAQNQVAEQVRADILLVTGQTYLSVLRAQAVVQVAEQTVKARQLVVDQITALAQSSLKSALDVSFANVNLADAKLLLVQAENTLKSSRAQLAAVLAVPGDTTFDLVDEPMPEPLSVRPDSLIQQALSDRPELKGIHLEQSAAEKFVRAEHALNYPNLGILGAAGIVPDRQPQIPERYGAIGFNLNIPIFNGWLFKARENEAELRAQATHQRANDLENQVARDVRVAYLSSETAYERVGLTEQLFKQSQTAFELAQSRYNYGLSSIVELSQAQLNLTSAQIALVGAKYECQAQRLNVDFQIGALK
jgi:outer membrane protein